MEEKTFPKMCENNAVVVVLMGLPGSGKTYFSKLLKKHFSQCTLLVFDEIIPTELQKELVNHENAWKEKRDEIVQDLDKYLAGQIVPQISSEVIKPNEVVIIDDNNYYRSMRYSYFQLARKHQLGYCQFYLNAPESLARSRNAQRPQSQRVPEDVIYKMNEKMEPPNPLKNYWEQFSFSIAIGDMTSVFDLCKDMLLTASRHPVQQLEPEELTETRKNENRAKCNANVIHQADKILRKKVSENLKSIEKANIKAEAKKQNETKDVVLEDLRTGFSVLPKEAIKGISDKDMEPLKEAVISLFSLKLQES